MSITSKPPAADAGAPVPVSTASPARGAVDPAKRPAAADLAPHGTPLPAPAPAPGRAPLDLAAALRILFGEIRAAVADELEAAARLPLPTLVDAEPGNAGVALLRWLRAAAAAAGVDPPELLPAVERGYDRALEGLARGVAGETVRASLALAREVVIGGLHAPPGTQRSDPAGVPPYRPDLASTGRWRIARGATGPASASGERIEPIGEGERRGAEAPPEPAGPLAEELDLQGPMDAVRGFVETLVAGHAALFAQQWVYPACLWMGRRWRGYIDPGQCAAGFPDLTRRLRAAGLMPARIVMLRVEPLIAQVATVRAVLGRERDDGTRGAELESAFTAVRTDAGWRVGVWMLG
jgi:hypothetical protein